MRTKRVQFAKYTFSPFSCYWDGNSDGDGDGDNNNNTHHDDPSHKTLCAVITS